MTVYFPSNLKPTVNRGYRFGGANNLITVDTMGGTPIIIKDYKYGQVTVPVTFVGNRLTKVVFSDFFYGKINSGADKFYMNLDTGMGIEEHICQIIPGTLDFNGDGDPIWIISMQIRCERTPAQDAPFGGSLSDLYAIYGDDTDDLLAALNQFANIDLPVYF